MRRLPFGIITETREAAWLQDLVEEAERHDAKTPSPTASAHVVLDEELEDLEQLDLLDVLDRYETEQVDLEELQAEEASAPTTRGAVAIAVGQSRIDRLQQELRKRAPDLFEDEGDEP